MSANARPVERVRAALAGCDTYLSKPVVRGDVARALQSCSVPLPLDSRRP
jgi:CheY-like chemotaxis protein